MQSSSVRSSGWPALGERARKQAGAIREIKVNDDVRQCQTETELREFLQTTAKLVGYTLADTSGPLRGFAMLEGPGGKKLLWLSPWTPKGRIVITDPQGRARITISPKSSAAHAASEIRRRLISCHA